MVSKNFTKYSNKWFVGISIFLAGCGTVKTPAGPTCVSCKPYLVRGSWYHPQTFYEYDEIGLASWYGDDCHGKMKATGEKFNKLAMTAAHRTLPLPSVVRVTNLRNGKSVIVVVDDRGPYCYTGRIIDLSYGAAKVLDLHRYKPSAVRVQTLVADSIKLSRYIATHCRRRKDPFGRTWAQLYFQEILGINPRRRAALPVASRVKFSNHKRLGK
jgi:rare lipoprotein A (peptidoglycan hydrolase)